MNFKAHQPHRSTGVMLLDLWECHHDEPLDLCGASLQIEKMTRLYQGLNRIKAKYGKHTLFLGSSVYTHPPVYHPQPYPPPVYRRPPVRREHPASDTRRPTVLRHLLFMAVFALTAISTAVAAEYPQNLPQDFKQALQQFNCSRNWPEAVNIDGYHHPSDDWLVVVHGRPDHEFLISYLFRNGEERILEIYLDRDDLWTKIELPSDDDVETSVEQYNIRQTLNYGADCVTLHFPVPKQ